jgi:hypothetical protein
MLWNTVKKDSLYWRERGALLFGQNNTMEKNANARMPASLYQIRYADIQIERMVGVGQFGEVFRGLWQHTTVAVKKLKFQSSSSVSGFSFLLIF